MLTKDKRATQDREEKKEQREGEKANHSCLKKEMRSTDCGTEVREQAEGSTG